jgi:hypothetical protein
MIARLLDQRPEGADDDHVRVTGGDGGARAVFAHVLGLLQLQAQFP